MIETYNDVVHVTGKQVKENGYKKAVEERKISAIKLKVASRVVGFMLSLPFSLPPSLPPLFLSLTRLMTPINSGSQWQID